MTVNLLELAKSAVGTPIQRQVGEVLGQHSERIAAAVDVVVPVLLYRLRWKASTQDGVDEVCDSLREYDEGMVAQMPELLGRGRHDLLLQRGAGLLELLLGARQADVMAAVGKTVELPDSVIRTLASLLAPLVMGVVGREARAVQWDANQVTALLASQDSQLAAALPESLHGILLSADSAENQPTKLPPTETPPPSEPTLPPVGRAERQPEGGEMPGESRPAGLPRIWATLLPLVLLACLAWLGYHYLGPASQADAVPAENQAIPTPLEEVP